MFLSDLVVSPMVGTRNTFRLKEDLIYKLSNGIVMVIPKGFVYDGASIPSILTNILPRFGYKYDRASCLHDWLYAAINTHNYNRKECDEVFYEAMLSDKVNKNLAKLMYLAVRVFGSKYYGGNIVIRDSYGD